jgi:CSLREA domain-containing protein
MCFSRVLRKVTFLLVVIFLAGAAPAAWATVNSLLQVQSELVVNTAGDSNDALPGDGLCQTASGDCTLRAALVEANALPGVETIAFNIPGAGPHLIRPESPLPRITEAVILDGTTQPGYEGRPVIELAGSQAGQQASGLTITASDSLVRGLAIHSFDRSGIHLSGGQNNQIEANYLGTTGQVALGNGIGVLVEGSTLNSIGGNESREGNLISGNEVGVYLYGSGTSENTIAGNLIGLDATGTVALGNEYGIRITSAEGNLVGGNNASARNLITGNETGIYIQGEGAGGNRIWGNYIGLDVTGETILGNESVGVYILDAPSNQVGGPNAAGNVIAGGDLAVYIRGEGS